MITGRPTLGRARQLTEVSFLLANLFFVQLMRQALISLLPLRVVHRPRGLLRLAVQLPLLLLLVQLAHRMLFTSSWTSSPSPSALLRLRVLPLRCVALDKKSTWALGSSGGDCEINKVLRGSNVHFDKAFWPPQRVFGRTPIGFGRNLSVGVSGAELRRKLVFRRTLMGCRFDPP